jgi:hypothetical protein
MRKAFAHHAVLESRSGLDHRAPGGAVTIALCGSLDHEPPCPLAAHHTTVDPDGSRLLVRILFATEAADEERVRTLVDAALATGEWTYPDGVVSLWTLVSSGPSAVREDESEHADRLVAV